MFFLLSVVFFSAVFSVLISTSVGAINYTPNSENKFVTYENSTEGTKIGYPKGWTVIRQYGLAFLPPKENDSDTFRKGLVVARGSIVNESIDKLADRVLKFYNSSLIDFRLKSKGITIHGNPAQSLITLSQFPTMELSRPWILVLQKIIVFMFFDTLLKRANSILIYPQ